jgi:hypothetical protein
MKKIMLADLVKDITDSYLEERALRIKELLDQFDITKDDATKIVDNYNDYDTQDLIAKAMEEYSLNLGEAEMFVDDHPNESEWADYEAAAEALGVDITDVDDDDVEAMSEIWDMGGSKGYVELDSDMGKGFIYYTKEYGWALLLLFNDGNPANYPISKDMARELSVGSLGKAYNEQMRNNPKYSDLPGSWGCIGDNPDNPKRLGDKSDFAKLPKDLQLLV